MRKLQSAGKVFSFFELLVCSHSSISVVMPLTLFLTPVPFLFPIKVRHSQNVLLSELKGKFSFNLVYISCEPLILLCPLRHFFHQMTTTWSSEGQGSSLVNCVWNSDYSFQLLYYTGIMIIYPKTNSDNHAFSSSVSAPSILNGDNIQKWVVKASI